MKIELEVQEKALRQKEQDLHEDLRKLNESLEDRDHQLRDGEGIRSFERGAVRVNMFGEDGELSADIQAKKLTLLSEKEKPTLSREEIQYIENDIITLRSKIQKNEGLRQKGKAKTNRKFKSATSKFEAEIVKKEKSLLKIQEELRQIRNKIKNINEAKDPEGYTYQTPIEAPKLANTTFVTTTQYWDQWLQNAIGKINRTNNTEALEWVYQSELEEASSNTTVRYHGPIPPQHKTVFKSAMGNWLEKIKVMETANANISRVLNQFKDNLSQLNDVVKVSELVSKSQNSIAKTVISKYSKNETPQVNAEIARYKKWMIQQAKTKIEEINKTKNEEKRIEAKSSNLNPSAPQSKVVLDKKDPVDSVYRKNTSKKTVEALASAINKIESSSELQSFVSAQKETIDSLASQHKFIVENVLEMRGKRIKKIEESASARRIAGNESNSGSLFEWIARKFSLLIFFPVGSPTAGRPSVRPAKAAEAKNRQPASNALSSAVKANNTEQVKTLLKTMSVNTIDKMGSTALHWAVQHQKEGMVRLLLENKADPFLKDRNGFTPKALHKKLGNYPQIKRLLEKAEKASEPALDAKHQVPKDTQQMPTQLLVSKRTDESPGILKRLRTLTDIGPEKSKRNGVPSSRTFTNGQRTQRLRFSDNPIGLLVGAGAGQRRKGSIDLTLPKVTGPAVTSSSSSFSR